MFLLVDTGSAVTIVHERAWCPLQQSLQKVNRPVIAANGEPLSILGRTEIRIVIAGEEFLHQVLIARDITQECILGADFLISHGFVIDLGNRLLRIGETSTPLLSSKTPPFAPATMFLLVRPLSFTLVKRDCVEQTLVVTIPPL